MNIESIYKNLGEFVIYFQLLEARFRDFGWLILDPTRQQWPPTSLRRDGLRELANKVQKLYSGFIDSVAPGDAEERKQAFKVIVKDTHKLCDYRNNLIHSAYMELKAGGEVLGILRINPRLEEDPISGELLWNQEALTEKSFEAGMKQMADISMHLNLHYIQLIHWLP